MDKNLNPINTEQFIGRDGKPYSSMEELSRADAMYENRQIMQGSIPDIDEFENHRKHR